MDVTDSPITDPLKNYRSAFPERDFNDHRQVYVGVHVPVRAPFDLSLVNGKRAPKVAKFPPRPLPKFRYENGKKKRLQMLSNLKQTDEESEAEITENGCVPPPASERVKFILGGGCEDEDTPIENPELFTELEELFVYLDGNVEWKETARWYKYEEDVEEGGDRWSKPHVATLSLYSLFELRSSLMAGTVILDMDANNLIQIADLVIDNLISCNKLEEIFRVKVKDTLLRRHRHQRASGLRRGLSSIIGRRTSNIPPSHGSQPSQLSHMGNTSSHGELHKSINCNGIVVKVEPPCRNMDSEDVKYNSSLPFDTNDLERTTTAIQRDDSVHGHLVYPQSRSLDIDEENGDKVLPGLMKKLPSNAEASNVLVGEVDFLDKPITAFVRLSTSSLLGDLTEIPIPTRFLFIMLGPGLAPGRYHEIGRAISTLMSDEVFHDVAYRAKSRADLIAGIDEFLEQVTVLPPGEWDPSMRIEPLQHIKPSRKYNLDIKRQDYFKNRQDSNIDKSAGSDQAQSEDGESKSLDYFGRTQSCFGGLVRDFNIWRSRKHDFSDGISIQCLGSVFFNYFALLSLIATLGTHLEKCTEKKLDRTKYILSLSINGILFTLISGQPMLILSSTIPIVIFEQILFSACVAYGLDFLTLRLWIGVWACLILVSLVMFDVSNYIGYITRFTLEIFLVVSAVVLFTHACIDVHHIKSLHPPREGYFTNSSCKCLIETVNNRSSLLNFTAATVPYRDCIGIGGKLVGSGCNENAYFFSLILTLFTVMCAIFFVSFRRTGFFPNKLRYLIGDFSTLFTVLMMCAVANSFNINAPYFRIESFSVALSRKPSLVPTVFNKNGLWTVFFALMPGTLLSLIIITEQQTTASAVNCKSNLLKKGYGYHLDLFAVSIGVFISSLFGLPFLAASVVLSTNNVQSLKVDVADDNKSFTGIREQRVTGIVLYSLLALTPAITQILKYIPIPVLYGVLIYSAIRTFHDVQFVQRFLLLFMPRQHRPEIVYLRQVPMISANITSVIQIICTVILWVVRQTVAAIAFPVMLFMLFGVRMMLEKLLPLHDILILDEPMKKYCLVRKCKPTMKAPSPQQDAEIGIALADVNAGDIFIQDESEEFLLDYHKSKDGRVNISEELSKTAVWKALSHAENSSPVSNSPNINQRDGKKRRRKRPKAIVKREDSVACSSPDGAQPEESQSDDKGDTNELTPPLSEKKKKSKQKSSDKMHKIRLEKCDDLLIPEIGEAPPPPPWEQPYLSPPRPDFGLLLKIPEDDVSVDPACSRTSSNDGSVNASLDTDPTNPCDFLKLSDLLE